MKINASSWYAVSVKNIFFVYEIVRNPCVKILIVFLKKADSITYHAYIVYFSLSGGQARQVTSSDPASVSSIRSATACTTSHAQRRGGGGLCLHPVSHWS